MDFKPEGLNLACATAKRSQERLGHAIDWMGGVTAFGD